VSRDHTKLKVFAMAGERVVAPAALISSREARS